MELEISFPVMVEEAEVALAQAVQVAMEAHPVQAQEVRLILHGEEVGLVVLEEVYFPTARLVIPQVVAVVDKD